ncbi:MAG: AMIN domain-containing protein [Leptolyngbyaceae cyanobacterium]
MGFKHGFYQFFGGSFAALALSVSPAFAGELDDWEFDTGSSELTFSLSDQVFPSFFLMSEPPRLVLDIPDTEIGDVEPEQIYNGTVQAIRVAQHTPENVRVVIELAPGITLSPGQADIQFDNNGDGQRHWRFRPLIADDAAVAKTPTADPGSENNEVSLSAASLQPSQQQATSTALPLDPYESDASDVVSVPPLEDEVSVPPLEDVPESTVPVAIATEAESPELPPMTAPELEAVDVENTEAPLETLETRPSSLPEVSANTVPPDVAVPDSGLTSESSQSSSEENAAISDSTPPSANEVAPAAETALAPVESSVSEQPAFDETANPAAPTIQQPAAERTIMQTDMPAPLTFGQPLPE